MSRTAPRSRLSGEAIKWALYLETDMFDLIQAEAKRQDRSPAWIVRQALEIGMPQVRAYPAAGEVAPASEPASGGVQ